MCILLRQQISLLFLACQGTGNLRGTYLLPQNPWKMLWCAFPYWWPRGQATGVETGQTHAEHSSCLVQDARVLVKFLERIAFLLIQEIRLRGRREKIVHRTSSEVMTFRPIRVPNSSMSLRMWCKAQLKASLEKREVKYEWSVIDLMIGGAFWSSYLRIVRCSSDFHLSVIQPG